MSRFFKAVALFALIACGVWIAVLWHWQSTARDISTRDIVTYLVALPVTLFVFALLLRWAWLGLAEKQSQPAPGRAEGADAAKPSAASAEDVARHRTVQLLAAHVVCAAGDSASDLQSAAKDGDPRPSLDAELRDEDGLPIITARIRDIDVPAMTMALEPMLAAARARRPEWAAQVLGDHVVRALAALERPVRSAVDSLLPWSGRFATAREQDRPRGESAESAVERRVRVLLAFSPEWNDFEQEVGRACVAEWLASSAAGLIPADRFAISMHAGHGEDLLVNADRLLLTLEREGRDEPLIVAACHSAIGDRAVEAMERANVLYSPKRPKGRMPAEAAAALVLAGADWPAAPDADGPLPHMHRPTLLRRDKSVDATGRIDGEVVGQTITHALANSRLGGELLGGLVCDADLHSARAAEFYGAAVGMLPTLDSTEDMRLLATVTGAVGVVSPLLVVACAAERAKTAEKPQLAVTLGDPFARLALVVLPTAPSVPEKDDNIATKEGAA